MKSTRKLFSVKNSKDREFWFSHLIILAGTIIGVYLAASAGLKAAVQFELIKSDRDSFYMRTALLDELQDNLNNIHTWGSEYRGGNARKFIGKSKEYKLDRYVWITMQDSPGTFEIPSNILTKIRRYYASAEIGLSKMTSRGPAADDVDKLLKETKQIQNETLLNLKSNINDLKTRLDDLDIPY